ncbi:putative glycoside hydrolase [Fictibacillus sp. B-59209]|uniref:putative glycoside hydrolase n=1 Tax=Fictibacillus sp. B-59209 TaxID=3024873 RepID=UPI002E1F4912|nr:putative glycoside hydrolase [Fictibacillus sp. B-59209]
MKRAFGSISLTCLLLVGGLAGCGTAEKTSGSTTNETKAKDQPVKKEEAAKERKVPVKKPKDVKVKGVYMSGASSGNNEKFNELVKLVDDTELNALVVDVKEDDGKITYDSKVPAVNQYGSDQHPKISNISQRMKVLKNKDIYTIARIVTFKDPYMAKKKPEYAMKKKSGGLYYNDGIPWVDPYNEEYWSYVTSIAKEAAKQGFDEIQFDYVRFPDNGAQVDREVKFDNPDKKSKEQNIHDFLLYAKKDLKPYGVKVSADVFGVSTSQKDDSGIGQQWESVTPTVDVISPMTYPSHYGPGVYGISVPDAKPYELIKKALQYAVDRDKVLEKQKKPAAEIRPWYQDFTATWVDGHIEYGPQQVKDQIRAGQELGVDEYLLWNPKNKYTEEAFKKVKQ